MLAEFRKIEALGLFEFVLTSEPLGEAWIVGYQGQILKMDGNGEAASFLAGLTIGLATALEMRHA
jgi:hypothetical protein